MSANTELTMTSTNSANFLADQGYNIAEVRAAYYEPHRVYHGPQHIDQMLIAVNEMADLYEISVQDRVHLHLATWFHDAIYVVGASDNEERSAEWAYEWIARQNGSAIHNLVHDLVMITKTHNHVSTLLEAILVDADLQGLGTIHYDVNRVRVLRETFGTAGPVSPSQFATYLASSDWRDGRKKFLKAYLSRPTLFWTSWGAKYEGPARENMKYELTFWFPDEKC